MTTQLKPGDVAPGFTLPDQYGIPATLDQWRGHNIIMWWYPKADTPG